MNTDTSKVLLRSQEAIHEILRMIRSNDFSPKEALPYIGADYFTNELSQRTLVVIDSLGDKMLTEFRGSNSSSPSFCAYAMETNSSVNADKIQKKIVCELHSDKKEDIKTVYSELKHDIDGMAFYSFVFPEWKRAYPSKVNGQLLDIYIDMFAKVVEHLAPGRVLFYGNQTLRLINRKKRPNGFHGRTIEEFLEEQGTSFKTISLKKNVTVKRSESSQVVTDEEVGQRTVEFAKKVKEDLNYAYDLLFEQYDNLDDKFGTEFDINAYTPQDDEYNQWAYYHLVKDKILNLVFLAQKEIDFFETKSPKDYELVDKTEYVKQLLGILKSTGKAVSLNQVYAFMEYMDWYKNNKTSGEKPAIETLSVDEILERAKRYVEQKPAQDDGKKSNARGVHNVLRAVYKKLIAGSPDDVIYAKDMKNHFLKIRVPFAVDKASIKSSNEMYWDPEKKPERK